MPDRSASSVPPLDDAQISRGNGVTPRAAILALLGAAFVASFCPFNDYRLGNTFFVGNHLPIGIVFTLVVLTLLVNALVKRLREGAHLSPSELVLIWAVMTAAASVPSSNLMRYWFNALVLPHHLAEQFTTWEPILKHLDPRLLASTDPASAVTQGFVYGESTVPWKAWLPPLLRWSVLLLALYGMFLCLSAFIRRQWVEHESLPFPLARFLLELVREPERGRAFNSFYRNRLAWVGAAIPIFFYLIYGLSAYYPGVPHFDFRWRLDPLFRSHPWNTIDSALWHGKLYLSIAAIAALLPSDMSFSVWFFLIFRNLVLTLAVWLGYPRHVDMERMEEFGGYVVFFLLLLYISRGYIIGTLRALCLRSTEDGRAKWRAPTASLVGFVVCFLVAWIWLWYWGMGPVWSLAVLAIFVIQNIILTRAVAEAGFVYVKARFALLHPPLYLFGVRIMGMSSAMMLAMLSILVGYDLRESLLPYAANNWRMASATRRMQFGRFFLMMAAGIVLAMIVGSYVHLRMDYRYGIPPVDRYATLHCYQEYFNRVVDHDRHPAEFGQAYAHFGVGAVFTAFLGIMRVRFPWWPFHPLGFIMSYNSPTRGLWMSFLVGWLVKTGVMRYGGSRAYLRLRPFAYGVILGECLIAGFWMFVTLAVYLSGHEPVRVTVLPL